MPNEPPVLTLSQLRGWEERRNELQILIDASAVELQLLSRQIDAAKMLMDLLPRATAGTLADDIFSDARANPGGNIKPEDSISGVVLSAVATFKGSAKANLIRDWISKNHPAVSEKLDANPAYLYTSLMRHVRGGRLAKRGKSYRMPTSKSLPAESTETSIQEAVTTE